jgi:hypothetical protein
VLSALPQPTAGPLRQITGPSSPAGSRSPRPAARPAAIKAPAPRPTDEEEPNWESIAPDTDDPKAKVNTAPLSRSSSPKQRPAARPTKSHPLIDLPEKVRLWVIIGISAVVVLSLLGLGILLSFLLTGKANSDTKQTEVRRKPLEVSTEVPGAYLYLQKAVDNAGTQDRILVKSHIAETVYIKDKNKLVIETEREITWQPPKASPSANPTAPSVLLTIENCSDVIIRGFTMDGGEKLGVTKCINIWGKCPGVVVEKMQLKNFLHSGVLINNCEGTSAKPVSLSNIQFTPRAGQPDAVGIFFDLMPKLRNNPTTNRWITIKDIDFPGTIAGQANWIVKKKDVPIEEIKTNPLKVEER